MVIIYQPTHVYIILIVFYLLQLKVRHPCCVHKQTILECMYLSNTTLFDGIYIYIYIQCSCEVSRH